MERTDAINSGTNLVDNNSIPMVSEWLDGNLQGMQQTSEQFAELIKEDLNSSTKEIALAEEFNSMYQSLAEQYNQISGESQQMETQETVLPYSNGSLDATPELKLQPHNLDHHYVGTNLSSSSGDGSSGTSLQEGTESSSLSSDSESEHFTSAMNVYLDTVKQINDHGVPQKKSKLVIEPICMDLSFEEVDADDSAKRSEHGSYDKLIARLLQYEEEVKVLNLKLQQSEEEVTMLKTALGKSDEVAHDLQVQIEAAESEIEEKETNLEHARGKMLELENHVADSHCKTDMLLKELEQVQGKLERSNRNEAKLTLVLASERQKVVQLQRSISVYEKDASDREDEFMRLQYAFTDAKRKHSLEKEQLVMQWESQCKQLEENLRQREDEMKELHCSLLRDMQDNINNSKLAIEEKEAQIHRLSKENDGLKLSHDTVVAERDGLLARVQAPLEELKCRENNIKELAHEAKRAFEFSGKLKLRVLELQNEVEMQKAVISEGAEKKREAIRQLCFSLEHYRTGYHELREAFRGRNKRHAGLAF